MRSQLKCFYSGVRRQHLLWLAIVISACADAKSSSTATRADSAGIEIVSSPGPDKPLAWKFEKTATIASDDSATGAFSPNERTVRTDGAGHIYVLDDGGNRVLMYDADGKFVRAMGRAGSGPGEMKFPLAMTVSNDGVVSVFEMTKSKAVRFGNDGAPLDERAVASSYPFFGGGFADVGGELYYDFRKTVDSIPVTGIVRAIGDSAVMLLQSPGAPPKAIMIKSCGMGFNGIPPIFMPTYRWDARHDWLAVTNEAAYNIRIYKAGKDVRRIRRAITPQPATAELAAKSLGEGMKVRTERGERTCSPIESAEQRGFAPTIPTIERIAVAPDGGLWVRRGGVPKEDQPIDIFAPDGAYMGTLPSATPFPAAFLPDGRLVVVESNDADVPQISVYRVTR